MALTRRLLSFLLLSSLLIISSASQNPNIVDQRDATQTLLDHDQLLDNTLNIDPTDILGLGSTNEHNQKYDHVIYHDDQQNLLHDQLHDNLLNPTTQYHYEQYYQKSEGKETLLPTKPDYYYEKSNPGEKKEYSVPTKLPYNIGEQKNYDQVKYYGAVPTKYIAIRGLILCNSGEKYEPLKGAKARITFEAEEDKNGYGKTTDPFSIVTDLSDENGFFFKVLSLSYVHKAKLNLNKCKVYLEAPSAECSCKVPTDVNYGKSGARLSSARILNDKILYTVGPFIYTSSEYNKPAVPKYQSVPGGY